MVPTGSRKSVKSPFGSCRLILTQRLVYNLCPIFLMLTVLSSSSPLQGAVAAVFSPMDLDPAGQARKFIEAFRRQYGERHPHFQESGFRAATSRVRMLSTDQR